MNDDEYLIFRGNVINVLRQCFRQYWPILAVLVAIFVSLSSWFFNFLLDGQNQILVSQNKIADKQQIILEKVNTNERNIGIIGTDLNNLKESFRRLDR